MSEPDRQRELRQIKDRKSLRRWAERMKRDEFRAVEDAIRRWREAPPPPAPDDEPRYKP